jgi:16S rRNA (cytosine967-C5)-methyltransferase
MCACRAAGGGKPARLCGRDGGCRIWPPDPARLLARGRGGALDLCAAPGGKTMQLAAAGWQVTALDASARRLERVRENLARTGLSADLVAADALAWQPPAPSMPFCWMRPAPPPAPPPPPRCAAPHWRAADRGDGRAANRAAGARGGLAEAGRVLVYATCSLEREEGEEQAARMTAGGTLTPDPIRAEEVPAGLAPTSEGWLRTDPGMFAEAGGLDGFFVARWRR